MASDQVHIEKPLPHTGDQPAVTFFSDGIRQTCLTYDQLETDIRQFARFLSQKKVGKSDRVVLLMEKSLIFIVAHLALFRLGAVSVPLNPGFRKEELSYLLKDCAPALVIADADKAARINEAAAGIDVLELDQHKTYTEHTFFKQPAVPEIQIPVLPDDPALMIYTSGTTGNPKGALLSLSNLNSDAQNIIRAWKLSKQDVLCHALPLFHVHGLCFALHTMLLCGGHIVMTDRFYSPDVLARLASKKSGEKISVFMAVPTMYTMLMDHIGERQIDFAHIRLLTSGSAPLREKDFERIHTVFGSEPVEREGMSETGMNFSNPLPEDGIRKPGSIGLPLEGVKVRVVDPDTGRDVENGMTGEFWLKSPSIIKKYWNKPEQTAQTFCDGWFKTGDLGRVDDDGYYYLTDRLKHLIITGGENVSAKAVESVIDRIEGVNESAVVGVPDEKWGEKVVAAVVMEEKKFAPEDIIRICKGKMQGYKCPKEVRFVDGLPRNTMGKVLKESVKQWFTQQ